ncbi:metallophosphoesterase [Streptosporangium sp. NPDC020072]|uniref:metallophosphoesterase n=1 Tax=Streptosporangium sp. NPDC020072 TaxID=3154788 RepID=UPI00341393EC
MRKILFYPDAQIPYHNPNQLKALHAFTSEWEPDEVVIIGDFMDFPQPSQWSKGTKSEFESGVERDSETGRKILADLRGRVDGKVSFIEGNHDLRPRAYLTRYAPALAESRAFHIATLLDFGGLGVDQVADWYEFTPGWIATHGHLGLSLSTISGRTAVNAAKKIGRSVVMGHVHRLAVSSETTGYQGKATTLTGVEVGHIMDVRPGKTPPYLKTGMANWQSGFAVAYVDGSHVQPVLVPMNSAGGFTFEGDTYTKDGKSYVR